MLIRGVVAALIAAAVGAGPTAPRDELTGPDPAGQREALAERARVARPFTFAVIGDTPYGATEIARFPGFITLLDRRRLQGLVHLGDIKGGSETCSDSYLRWVRSQFRSFAGPVFYTPGDNEWADCPGAPPAERLRALRTVFFRTPRTSLGGQPVAVRPQVGRGVPENVRFRRAAACFATLHVVGGNDASGVPAQEYRRRAALANLRGAFEAARRNACRAVVIAVQADMANAQDPSPDWSSYSAYRPLVRSLVAKAASYGRPVLLLNGDSHVYRRDRPFAPGSPWLTFYGLDRAAPNILRVTVAGEARGTREFVRVALRPERKPYLVVRRVLLD